MINSKSEVHMSKSNVFGFLALVLIALSVAPSEARGSFKSNHPRRAQVLCRNERTNSRLNADKGSLGGHFNQLKGENRAIHQQERGDAQANGGHITKAEQHTLNQEHNQLNKQIRSDR
jgi:hypothetical protein